jgi:pyruvate/2-oxoglutarate/acetoin dehydrogenase E1 component/TPP-dependent pyruvate/acetoin dehydrogenase alpha subunit
MPKGSPGGLPQQAKYADPLLDKESVLRDFETCCLSREASILARKEVLTGKGKFGITGDGKEVPQVALARVFQAGDFRSGYYRDQTWMFALGISTLEDFFAQLYADPNNDPFSGGRQMNNHFATPLIDPQTGAWLRHTEQFNISSDVSCTGGQMPRALGLAQASRIYRDLPALESIGAFSANGAEVCFCSIGDASTSEGIFWETLNAAGVLQVPLAVSVWDDGYGISVPIELQTTKGSISEALMGFQTDDQGRGVDIYTAKAWDYPGLVSMYAAAVARMRKTHRPALFHIQETTQPQGHSTSGSHERYKTKARLEWEQENDCIVRMERWMLETGLATQQETDAIRSRVKKYVRECRDRAWKAFHQPTEQRHQSLKFITSSLPDLNAQVVGLKNRIKEEHKPLLSDLVAMARQLSMHLHSDNSPAKAELKGWIRDMQAHAGALYHTHLYSETPFAATKVPYVPPVYDDTPLMRNGFEILNAFFDKAFAKYPQLLAFGEDVGQIGDVNQGFAGLQKKYGKERIFDTGIREASIMGQAIGLAMRGFRPIAEIQYLDYLIYGLEPLHDDLATLRYRSNGIQMAPAIIRTRGHRLEGIWHTGSPMGMILGTLRGMYVITPRNMTQAAGFYNTMLQSDEPALIIECLNGYRLKEALPANIGEYTTPVGVPEILRTGADVTLLTYGSCVRIAQSAAKTLELFGISVELIDAQTLLPFDTGHLVLKSLQKTNRLVILDEDVPGGASAYLLREVLEVQGGYQHLDSPPRTITAKPHRTPYGSDGDYFSKPNAEDVVEAIFDLIQEADPARFRTRI